MKTILIVDADRSTADNLEPYFDSDQFKIHRAPDPDQAMRFLRGYKIDIVILDSAAPDNGSLHFLQQVRQSEHHRAIPVIFMDGTGNKSVIMTAIKIGVASLLAKPVSPQLAQIRVDKILEDISSRETQEKQMKSEHLLVEKKPNLVLFIFPSNLNGKSLQYVKETLDAEFRNSTRKSEIVLDFGYQTQFDRSQLVIVGEIMRSMLPRHPLVVAGENRPLLAALDLVSQDRIFNGIEDLVAEQAQTA